jgi:TorA maturation chaperone TorD
VDEALTYGSVYAKLEEIMNSTRNIREFLSNYLARAIKAGKELARLRKL